MFCYLLSVRDNWEKYELLESGKCTRINFQDVNGTTRGIYNEAENTNGSRWWFLDEKYSCIHVKPRCLKSFFVIRLKHSRASRDLFKIGILALAKFLSLTPRNSSLANQETVLGPTFQCYRRCHQQYKRTKPCLICMLASRIFVFSVFIVSDLRPLLLRCHLLEIFLMPNEFPVHSKAPKQNKKDSRNERIRLQIRTMQRIVSIHAPSELQ